MPDPTPQMLQWVNEGNSGRAVEPVYYPVQLREDFYSYHPYSLPDSAERFMVNFEINEDEAGPYMWINATGELWDPATRDIMSTLRLRPVLDAQGDLLEVMDDRMNAALPSGWVAKCWRTAPMPTASGESAFIDEITWLRQGQVVTTAWAWLVY